MKLKKFIKKNYIDSDLQVYGIPEGIFQSVDFINVSPSFMRNTDTDIRPTTIFKKEPKTEVLSFKEKSFFHAILGFSELKCHPEKNLFH